MATIPSAMLIGISSPYRKAGALFEAHRDHFGREGDAFTWERTDKVDALRSALKTAAAATS